MLAARTLFKWTALSIEQVSMYHQQLLCPGERVSSTGAWWNMYAAKYNGGYAR